MNWLLQRLIAALPRLERRSLLLWLIALGLSVAKSVKTGRWHRFRHDRRGFWTHEEGDVVFVSPTLHTLTLERVTEGVDQWCHGISLGEGNIVVDIGAGDGQETLVFSRRVGSKGRVIAIEAHPLTARCVEFTVALNRLENVSLLREAAWDEETVLFISNESGHVANVVGKSGRRGTIAVRGRPVDAMLAPFDLPSITLLKMNIEGAEGIALAGMKKTLAQTQTVVVACHDFLAKGGVEDPMRTKARVIGVLTAAGFVVSTRPDARQRFVRDNVYGRRENTSSSAV